MQLRKMEVITALFESYLYIRKDSWGFDINNPSKSYLKQTPTDKIKFCGNMIADIEAAASLDDFVKILHKLADKERVEAEEVRRSWGRPFDLLGLIYDRPMLLETLRAARAYLISLLKDEQEFKVVVSNLKKQLDSKVLSNEKPDEKSKNESSTLLREIADLEDIDASSLDKYFDQITKNKDSRVKILKENSFANFEKNVLDKVRVLDDKIIMSAKMLAGHKDGAPLTISVKEASSNAQIIVQEVATSGTKSDAKNEAASTEVVAATAPRPIPVPTKNWAVLFGSEPKSGNQQVESSLGISAAKADTAVAATPVNSPRRPVPTSPPPRGRNTRSRRRPDRATLKVEREDDYKALGRHRYQ